MSNRQKRYNYKKRIPGETLISGGRGEGEAFHPGIGRWKTKPLNLLSTLAPCQSLESRGKVQNWLRDRKENNLQPVGGYSSLRITHHPNQLVRPSLPFPSLPLPLTFPSALEHSKMGWRARALLWIKTKTRLNLFSFSPGSDFASSSLAPSGVFAVVKLLMDWLKT